MRGGGRREGGTWGERGERGEEGERDGRAREGVAE